MLTTRKVVPYTPRTKLNGPTNLRRTIIATDGKSSTSVKIPSDDAGTQSRPAVGPVPAKSAPKAPLPRPDTILAGAERVASELLQNGQLLEAEDLKGKLKPFDWFPGGSDSDVNNQRLKALAYVYAVFVLHKRWPNEFSGLKALLRKSQGLKSPKANVLCDSVSNALRDI
jgi:hypothetical protein